MHTHDLTPWTHDHRFDKGSAAAERSTWIADERSDMAVSTRMTHQRHWLAHNLFRHAL